MNSKVDDQQLYGFIRQQLEVIKKQRDECIGLYEPNEPKYRITFRKTITDPVERRNRLNKLFGIFEREEKP